MFPVAVMAGAGWLFLFVVLLIVPPSPGPHEGGGQGEGRTARRGRTRIPEPGDVPPAVVSLLAGLLPVVEGRLRELARRIDFNQY
jgi:hypothetical protein